MYLKWCFILKEKAWHKKETWVLESHRSELEKHFCHIGTVRLTILHLSFQFFNTIVAGEIENELCLCND